MKLIQSFILILLSTMNASSQNSDFIKTTVVDTVQVMPNKITYSFMLKYKSYRMFIEMLEKGEDTKKNFTQINKEMHKKFEELLNSKKIDFEKQIDDSYWVIFSSYAELNALIREINASDSSLRGGLAGRLISFDVSNREEQQDLLFEKCFTKAKDKVAHLAKIAEIKVGKLFELIDETNNPSYNRDVSYRATYLAELNKGDNDYLEAVEAQKVILKSGVTLKYQID